MRSASWNLPVCKNIVTVELGHAPTGQLRGLRVWMIPKGQRFATNPPLKFRKYPVEAYLYPTVVRRKTAR